MESDFRVNEARQAQAVRVAGAMVGGLGGKLVSSTDMPLTPTGSLTHAIQRLATAIEANGQLIAQTSGKLENIGVLRLPDPRPESGQTNGKAGMESQLASGIQSLAAQLESHNGRLADVFNRIDL